MAKRNNILKALAGSSWGQQKETLLVTYKAIGRSIANYAAPVWTPNTSHSSFKKIQTSQNAALRTITGCLKLTNIDHLHQETTMLPIKEHSDLLAAQYLAGCIQNELHPCHNISNRPPPPRQMKETLYTKYHQLVQPLLIDGNSMASKKAIHSAVVTRTINNLNPNVTLGGRPPPISTTETSLSRKQRTTLAQLRSGYCSLLNNYKHRLDAHVPDTCSDCGVSPHDIHHLFHCPAHPSTITPEHLWSQPHKAIVTLGYLDNELGY